MVRVESYIFRSRAGRFSIFWVLGRWNLASKMWFTHQIRALNVIREVLHEKTEQVELHREIPTRNRIKTSIGDYPGNELAPGKTDYAYKVTKSKRYRARVAIFFRRGSV